MQKIVGKSLKPRRERYTYQLARRYFHRHQQYWHDFQMFSHQMLTFTLYSKCLKQIIQLRNYYGSTNFPVQLEPWHHWWPAKHMFVPFVPCQSGLWPADLGWRKAGLPLKTSNWCAGTRFGMVHWITIGATFKSQSCWHDATRFTFPPFDDLEPRFAVGTRCFPRWNVKRLP